MCIRQKKHNSVRLQYPESIQESNRAVVRAGAQLLRSHPQPTRTTYNCNFKNCRYYLHIKWFRAKRMSRAYPSLNEFTLPIMLQTNRIRMVLHYKN